MKRIRYGLAAVLVLFSLVLQGCWNYRGMDELDIVTGIAIDLADDGSNLYHMTIEIVDIPAATQDNMTRVKYVEARGENMLDTVRNAKRRLINRVYLGNMQTLVISRQLAEQEGIFSVMEGFLRDTEPRERLTVAISQEESAKEVLLTKGLDSDVIAFEINQSIEEDSKSTASTRDVPLYKVYDAVKAPGNALVLPALHCVVNNDEVSTETNGVAVFRSDKLAGFLNPDQTKYYLFFMDEIKGGVLTVNFDGVKADLSLEIKESRTKCNYRYENGQLIVMLDIKTVFNLSELKAPYDLLAFDSLRTLEQKTAVALEQRMQSIFATAQTTIGIDIFGLGNIIYKRDPALWMQISDNWDTVFYNARLEVNPTVVIQNTGVLKNY